MLQWLIAVCLLHIAAAYSGGAGNAACSSYTPLHGFTVQSIASPYQVQVSADQYAASGTLTITLRGTVNNLIKGFYIGAAGYDGTDKTTTRHGTFAAAGGTNSADVTTMCPDNKALTHTATFSGRGGEETVNLTWTAPANSVGSIRFFVTFVKQKDTYWVAVPSDIIWDGQGTRPTDAPQGVVTDGPTVTPVIKDGCGVTESCYRLCKDDKCEFILKWKTDADKVNFQLVADNVEAPGYVALGLTSSEVMEDVTVVACTVDNTRSVSILTGFAESRTSGVKTVQSVSMAADEEGSYISDAKEITCRFSYNNTKAAGIKEYKDLNSAFNVIVARGPLPAGIGKHYELPKVSSERISLLQTGIDFKDFTGRKVYAQVKTHGCLMVAAWGFFASIGIIMARYYKNMWPNKLSCGSKIWFQTHVSFMVNCLLLTINGIVQIFVFNKAFILPAEYPDRLHPILGMIAFICAGINPIIAIFRCKPEDSNRPIFNWIHRFIGTSGFLCGCVAMVIGLRLEKILNPSWLYGLGIAVVLLHFIMEIVLFVHGRMHSSKLNSTRQQSAGAKDGRAEFQMEEESEPEGSGFKNLALKIYMAVVGILNVIIIIIMAINGSAGVDL